MNTEKNRRILYNIFSNVLYRTVIIAMGFIVPRLFLTSFGSEVNGLVSTVKQLLSYLVLLEAGLGLATQQALYKPVVENDRNRINGILSASRIFYNRTGSIYIVVILCFAIFYSYIVDVNLSSTIVFGIFILCAIPNAMNFFIKQKYSILLNVEGKNYIYTNLDIFLELITNFTKIAALMLTDNLLVIHLTYCISPVVQSAFTLLYIHKNYRWLNLKVKPNMAAISQKTAVLIHQISGTIFNNVDIILLSIICDFKTVSVYTVYMMFFSQIDSLISMISTSIRFRLGQLFHEDMEKFIHFHDLFEICYMTLIFGGYTFTAMFLLPVISLYTADINDADYIKGSLVILFVLINLLANGKWPSNQVIEFAGEFESTKYHAVIEMGINIVVSVFAIMKWGIYGGLVGTILALLFRSNAMIYVANRKILKRGMGQTYRRWGVNFLIFIAFLVMFGTSRFMVDTLQAFLLHALWYGILIMAVYILVNFIFERNTIRWVLRYVNRAR